MAKTKIDKVHSKLVALRSAFDDLLVQVEDLRSSPSPKRRNLKEARKLNFDRYYKKPKKKAPAVTGALK